MEVVFILLVWLMVIMCWIVIDMAFSTMIVCDVDEMLCLSSIIFKHKLTFYSEKLLFKMYKTFNWKLNLYVKANKDSKYDIYAKKCFIKFYYGGWKDLRSIEDAKNKIIEIHEEYVKYLNELKNKHSKFIEAEMKADEINKLLKKI